MDLFMNGNDLLKGFEEKQNFDTPFFQHWGNQDVTSYSDLFKDLGFKNDNVGHFKVIRDEIPSQTNYFAGAWGSSIAFGGADTLALLTVDPFNQRAKIIGMNAQGRSGWTGNLAFQSDIAKLEQEISDLKKQIVGGDKTPL